MKARVPLAALSIVALAVGAGCTGPAGPAGPAGDAGPPGPAGQTVITVPGNNAIPTDAASAAWAALRPQVTVQSVTIQSPPVVKFTVTDATTGLPVAGLGNTSKSSTATVASLTNLSFALAKLVPGSNASPNMWVSYIVTTVPTTTAPVAPSRPSTDATGTLVDNGDGSYAYTFYRDIRTIKDQVAGMTVSAPNNTADLGDLTYDPSLVHRLTIQVSGSAPGTGTNTPDGVQNVPGLSMVRPVDAIYDFTPATGQQVTDSGRDIVATQKCNECHRQLGGIPGDDPASSAAGFHGGNRNETRYCVVCHTEQRKYGRTEATFNASLTFTSTTYRFYDRALGNFPNHIHHIHAGPVLAYKNYDYAGVVYNETLFPQDLRNCTKCHDGSDTSTAKTPEGNNWMNVPSRLACGGCHDGIDFATGKGVTLADAAKGLTVSPQGHVGGIQPNDSNCVLCHADPNRPDININSAHLPVTPPNDQNALLAGGTNSNTNAAWIASNPARLPAGAIVVTYDIKSVSLDGSRHPVMVFRMLQNGARKDLNDPATATVNPATGQREVWDNFMGSPSLYFVFAVPQDGIQAPSDYNASVSGYLRTIWNHSATGTGAGTLAGPDADGYYTGTLTGVTMPTTAVMLTGGMGYSYNVTSTLPLTQTNLDKYPVSQPTASVSCATSTTNACRTGGLVVIAPNVQKVASGTGGDGQPFAGRRPIVEDARCNKCHQELGTFTQDAFHAGQRNDGTTCSWCHTPNRTSSGWSADSTSFIHAIHASAHRDKPFTWHASSTTDSFANVTFPGILGACETCHVPGAWDFSSDASQAALPNKQFRTVATGAFNGAVGGTITTYGPPPACTASQSAPATDVAVFSLSPYITPATPGTSTPWYGIGFAFNPSSTVTTNTCDQTTNVPNPPGGTLQASGSSLVNSPVATVCFSCHDADDAQAHMQLNGGSIYAPRTTALSTTETCLICHGPGRIAAISIFHNPQQ